MSRIVVIGAGNPLRGDDAAGRLVLDALAPRREQGIDLCAISGEGNELMEALLGCDAAWVIDAACEQGMPGRIHRFEAATESLPCRIFRHSTHDFGVAEGLELARTLRQLPPRVVVFAIEGRCFDAGARCSGEVLVAAAEVATRIRAELDAFAGLQACADLA